MADAQILAMVQDKIEQGALIFRLNPNFVPQVAGKGYAANNRGDWTKIHFANGHEWEC